MKKNISLLLVLLMLGSQFAACSDSTENAGETTADTTGSAAQATDTTAAEETEDASLVFDLEAQTFDGYTFNIYQHYVANGCHLDFMAEEITGEPINDADMERRTIVEDKCDVTIVPIQVDATAWAGHNTMEIAVRAGTNDYDLAGISAYSATSSLMAGLLTDLNTIDNLDMSKSWWDQYCNKECSFGDALYFMTGDISINDNKATYCYYFNKTLAADYQIPNMYDDVNNMTWTIDKFKEYATILPTDMDTDNDGKHTNDTDDTYAVWIWDDIMMGIVNSSGIKCATIDDQGTLNFTLNDEKLYNAFDKFTSYAFDTGITCAYQRSGYDQQYGQIGFNEGRGLFLLSYLWDATAFRDMEDDFGILPMPLYDETQERYYNSVASYPMSFFVVPVCTFSAEEYARTGYITQMLGYESKIHMTPAYYEQTLQNKVSRDVESAAMLDLIFSSRTYDFGWYFELGDLGSELMYCLRNYNSNLSSTIRSKEKTILRTIDKYSTIIAELGGE